MNASDWKWTPVLARLPADRQTVAIKFWDGSEAVLYGIGWYNAKEKSWGITAGPGLFAGLLVSGWQPSDAVHEESLDVRWILADQPDDDAAIQAPSRPIDEVARSPGPTIPDFR